MTRCMAALAALTLASASKICLAQQTKGARTSDSAATCAIVGATPVDHGNMDHSAHLSALTRCATAPIPTSPGQAAFGAIAEIVRRLDADPKTDWTRVNVEALRQHLIEMNEVAMQATAIQRSISGGIEVDVTGGGRTVDAIRRMTINHMRVLDRGGKYRASAKEIVGGARLTVTATNAGDATAVARVRGLGLAGLITEGDHHASHHIAFARGDSVHGR